MQIVQNHKYYDNNLYYKIRDDKAYKIKLTTKNYQ